MTSQTLISNGVLGTHGFTSFPKDLPAPGIDTRTSRLQVESVDHYAMEAGSIYIYRLG